MLCLCLQRHLILHYAFASLALPFALHAQNSHKVLKFHVCMYTLAIPHCSSSRGNIIMPTGSRGMSIYRMIAIKLKSVMTGKTCTGMHALYYSEWHIRHTTCSSSLTTRLEESGNWRKGAWCGVRTRALLSNTEFQPCAPPIWPWFNRCRYGIKHEHLLWQYARHIYHQG